MKAKEIEVGKEDLIRGFDILRIVAEAIKEAGEIPSGHLYSALMSHMDLGTYERIICLLIRSDVIRKSDDLLIWNGN